MLNHLKNHSINKWWRFQYIGLKKQLQSIFNLPLPFALFLFLISCTLFNFHSKSNQFGPIKTQQREIMVGPTLNSHNLSLKPIKFLCSYGGRIVPRYPDGKLRYQGGDTRVLSVDRSISFSDLLVKVEEMCGTAVSLRCQLPTEDLDALVSITSDEDLINIIEEYDRAAPPSSSSLKIKAFLFTPKSTNKVSPPQSTATSPKSPLYSTAIPPRCPTPVGGLYIRHGSKPPPYPVYNEKSTGKIHRQQCRYGNGGMPV